MGRIAGILFMVLGIWVGMEIFTQGVDAAFGGVFARWSHVDTDADPLPADRSPAQRIGDRVRESLGQGAKRTEEPLERVD